MDKEADDVNNDEPRPAGSPGHGVDDDANSQHNAGQDGGVQAAERLG